MTLRPVEQASRFACQQEKQAFRKELTNTTSEQTFLFWQFLSVEVSYFGLHHELHQGL
jgi:hypothetical protein